MATYNTQNPLGSADPRDLYDNAENADRLINGADNSYPDRLGNARLSWAGIEDRFQEFLLTSGYQIIEDPYAAGIEVTARNQVILADGEYWRLSASAALPYTTTGAGMPEGGSFVSVGDAALRQALIDPAQGGELVRVTTLTGGQSLAEALDGRMLVINITPSFTQTEIAAALSDAPDGSTIVFRPGLYGALVKDTTLTGFPDNDQPCLLLRGKTGVTIYGAGAVLSTDVHGQGILELQQCTDCLVEGLTTLGPANFPQLDGTTGRGEKGTATDGYDTRSFWNTHKNNSFDTSANTGGGFGGAFPQYGGGTASTVGGMEFWFYRQYCIRHYGI